MCIEEVQKYLEEEKKRKSTVNDTFPVNLKEIVLSKDVFPRRPAFLLKLKIKNVCFKMPPFILFSALNLLHQLGGLNYGK